MGNPIRPLVNGCMFILLCPGENAPSPKPRSTPTKANCRLGQSQLWPRPKGQIGPRLAPANALVQSRLWSKPTLLQPRSCPAPAKPTPGQGQARGMMTGKKHNKLRNLELNRRWPPMQSAGNNQKCKNNESKRWFGCTTQFVPGRICEQ